MDWLNKILGVPKEDFRKSYDFSLKEGVSKGAVLNLIFSNVLRNFWMGLYMVNRYLMFFVTYAFFLPPLPGVWKLSILVNIFKKNAKMVNFMLYLPVQGIVELKIFHFINVCHSITLIYLFETCSPCWFFWFYLTKKTQNLWKLYVT